MPVYRWTRQHSLFGRVRTLGRRRPKGAGWRLSFRARALANPSAGYCPERARFAVIPQVGASRARPGKFRHRVGWRAKIYAAFLHN